MDEEVHEATDRTYWENRGSKTTVTMADELLDVLKQLDPALELKYNKFYIGLARQGQADNFVIFRPQKNSIRVEPRLKKNEEIEQKIEAAGVDVMDYDNRWNRYRIRLGKGDVKKHADILRDLFSAAHREFGGGNNS
jgi:predicted transport protein